MQQLQQNITYTYRTQNGEAFIRREYNNTTLYASPYLVATNKGYTKHYYAESERIASKIGGGGLQNLHAVCDELYTDNTSTTSTHIRPRPYAELPALDFEAKRDSSKMHLKRLAGCIEGEMGEIKKNALVVLNQYAAGAQASPHSEDECYWYHPDHLGSASWVSDKAGKGIQHLYYLPWGEELDNQRATDYASRYTFSGKERDMETGYGYFGARYYNSDLSIWLSVDPLADKYPGLSPYTYCADNPVKLVDPDGREVYVNGKASDEVVLQINNHTSKGFSVSLDADGKMTYEGTARTKIDKLIQEAIDDKNITVNILADNSNSFGQITTDYGGAYMGNTYENGKVCTDQYVVPSMLAEFDKSVGDNKPGLTMIHELAESYYGGQIAMEEKQGSPYALKGENDMSTCDKAHFMANQIVIGNRGKNLIEVNFQYNPHYNSALPLSKNNPLFIEGKGSIWDGSWSRNTNEKGM